MEKEAVDRAHLVFSLFDADGNGHIDAADFDLMASRVVQAAIRSTDTDKRAFEASLRRFWTTLSNGLDIDHDGRITREEWTNGALDPELFSDTVAEFAEAHPRLGDPDGHSFVERPLFTDLMLGIGFASENIGALFDAMKDPESGRVRVSDWTVAIKEFYDPHTAQTPGNHLVPGATT